MENSHNSIERSYETPLSDRILNRPEEEPFIPKSGGIFLFVVVPLIILALGGLAIAGDHYTNVIPSLVTTCAKAASISAGTLVGLIYIGIIGVSIRRCREAKGRNRRPK